MATRTKYGAIGVIPKGEGWWSNQFRLFTQINAITEIPAIILD